MVAALCLALAAAGFGCGGEDASETTVAAAASAPPLPRPKFVARAGRLCENARLKAEQKGAWVFRSKAKLYERKGTIEEFRGSLRRQEIAIVLAPSMLRRLGEVRDLGIPRGDERQVEDILAAAREAATDARENPDAFLTSGSPLARARELARAYGIESCAILYDPEGTFQRASAKPGVRFTPRSSK